MNTKLKLLLLELSTPQYEVARRLGLSETRFSRIVRGRVLATGEERQLIAAHLGRSEHDVFGPKRGELKSGSKGSGIGSVRQ
jgi:hypothetical protein